MVHMPFTRGRVSDIRSWLKASGGIDIGLAFRCAPARSGTPDIGSWESGSVATGGTGAGIMGVGD